MKKIVGTNLLGYPQIRNFASLNFNNYQVVKKQDLFKIPSFLSFKLFNKLPQYELNSFWDLDLNKCDLYHFFNTISHGKKPWITTFETSLPRWGDISNKKIEKGLKFLANDNCKKLIAFSECTKNIQEQYIINNFPEYKDVIFKKLISIHPSQKILVENIDEKKTFNNEYTHFTFIGNQFFRKGGREAVYSTIKLYKEGLPVKLTIISKIETDFYASQTTKVDVNEILKIINKYPKCINLLGQISNQEVLNLLKKTDVALLPTYADTYGYSVLEAQASACPVISTDIRALPEINNEDIGWVINVPKDELGNGILNNDKNRKLFSKQLENNLYQKMYEILKNKNIIKEKSKKSIENIKLNHSISKKTKEIEKIYDDSIC
ncbi:MAG: hypothetical protein B6I24_01605 [Bacteroidetes bacterium 4572_128]|nr:MAG: hypothetical protein B6I24_01605 [Bacteroidetes bacterium 4572_128]